MTWRSFKDKKPENFIPLITRCTPWSGKYDAFEDWQDWNNDYLLTMKNITHWWDGEYNYNKAVKEWTLD